MQTSENAGFLKMNKLNPLKELLSSYYAHFLKKKMFCNRWIKLLPNKIL